MKHRLPARDRMQADLLSLGLRPLVRGEMERIDLLALLLEREAGRSGILGPREMTRLWPRHLLESMTYELPLGSPPVAVVDIGSGGGLPGLVLAVRGYDVTVVEPRRSRAAFLDRAVDTLGLSCDVLRSRLERLEFASGTRFVARAVAPPARLLQMVGEACRGTFTIDTRVPPDYGGPGSEEMRLLPMPPLDRPGALVQFRQTGAGC